MLTMVLESANTQLLRSLLDVRKKDLLLTAHSEGSAVWRPADRWRLATEAAAGKKLYA